MHMIGPTKCLRSLRRFSTAVKPQKWKSVVGLEVHAQIASKSKLFSGAEVAFGAAVNSCVSAFDASMPGTLPVLNRSCVESGIKTALALSCHINAVSMFDRKHYFYADLPAGYQITQQRAPLAQHGQLSFHVIVSGVNKKPYHKTVRLHQLQLEQDSGKSLHDTSAHISLVDLNRAGVPLMELVFEPDLSDGEEAAALVKELMLILTRLGTCSCRMEEGALRVDANISIHREGTPLGTRTEVKNIGSVRGVCDAITFEIARQIEVVDGGGRVHNETRSWDALNKRTVAMRDKEVQQDYRFMPEPNLPPLHLNVTGAVDECLDLIDVTAIGRSLPELPEQTRQKLMIDFSLSQNVAIILVNEQILLNYFYEINRTLPTLSCKTITNILINDLLMLCHKNRIEIEQCAVHPAHMAELMGLLQSETINLNLVRLVLQEMLCSTNADGVESPQEIVDRKGWHQIKDVDEITNLCTATIAKNPRIVEQYKNGKTKVMYALAGEIAKQTEQRANMAIVVATLTDLLGK